MGAGAGGVGRRHLPKLPPRGGESRVWGPRVEEAVKLLGKGDKNLLSGRKPQVACRGREWDAPPPKTSTSSSLEPVTVLTQKMALRLLSAGLKGGRYPGPGGSAQSRWLSRWVREGPLEAEEAPPPPPPPRGFQTDPALQHLGWTPGSPLRASGLQNRTLISSCSLKPLGRGHS